MRGRARVEKHDGVTTRARRNNRLLLVAHAGLLSAASLVNAFTEYKIPQLPGFEGSLDIKEGDAETLRTFTFDGDSACFMSSALYSSLGLGSLEMTYVGDARCPCE